MKEIAVDFDLHSPIGDNGRNFRLDLIDVAVNVGLFLLGISPALALVVFELWG